MGSVQIGDLSRGLHRHRAASCDLVGGGGIREGKRGEGRVCVECHRSRTARIEGRRVVHAEHPVETRSPAVGIPVGEVRPIPTGGGRPCRLTAVDQSGHFQEVGADLCQVASQRRVVPVDDPDHVGKGPYHLVGCKCQDSVA